MAVRVAGGIETDTIYEVVTDGIMPAAVQDFVYSGAYSLRGLGTTDALGGAVTARSYVYYSFAWQQRAVSVSKGAILKEINQNRIFGYNADVSPYRYVLMDTSWNVLVQGTAAILAAQVWYEIEIVVDAGQITVWIDGVQELTYDDSGNNTTDNARFGLYGEDEDGKEDYDARYDDLLALDNADGGWITKPNAFMRFDTACAPTADAPGYGGNEWVHLDDIPPASDYFDGEYAADYAAASVPADSFLRAVVLRGQSAFANPERFCIESAADYDLGAYALTPQTWNDEGHWMTLTPAGLAWTEARLNALYWGINRDGGTVSTDTNIMYICYADTAAPTPPAANIKVISGVAWANAKKVSGVAEASISKVSGVQAN